MEKVCKCCGKKFTTTNQGKEYCCHACARTQWAKTHYQYKPVVPVEREKVCEWCGKKFTTTRSDKKYCCRLCGQKRSAKKYYETHKKAHRIQQAKEEEQ